MSRPPLMRMQPKGPASAYKTYQFLMPKDTHTRAATCAEIRTPCDALLSGSRALNTGVFCQEMHCGPHMHGWSTTCDVSTPLGQKQATYIRMHSGRAFTSVKNGDMLTFRFPSGQTCFSEHRVTLEREPLYRVKGGDFRGNPLGTPTVRRNGRDWLEDLVENRMKIADLLKKG